MISTIKKRFCALSSGTLLSFSLFAQQGIEFSELSHNLGTLYWKHPAQATFTIKNTSNQSLNILDVDADCGCTTASFTQTAIQPGKTGTVSVRYDAQQLGHFNRSLGVYTNFSEDPTYLTITGEVVNEKPNLKARYDYHFGSIDLSTDDLEFEDIKKGSIHTKVIDIINRGKTPITPLLMHLPKYLSASYSPDVLYPGRTGRIILTLDSDLIETMGLTQSSVYLSTRLGERVRKENEINVSVTLLPELPTNEAALAVAPVLALDKDSINFGSFDGKSKLTEEILITNQGKSDLVLEALQVYNPGISVKLRSTTLKPGDLDRIKITINEDILRSKRKRRILLITNDPRQPKVVIKIGVKG